MFGVDVSIVTVAVDCGGVNGVSVLRSGSGSAHQPGGVQCQEQVLSDGDGDGGGAQRHHRA